MTNNRQDFVGPILLAIFAYLASMLTRAFQRSIENSYMAAYNPAVQELKLNYTIANAFLKGDKHDILLGKLQDPKVWEDCSAKGEGWWDGKSEPKNIFEELSREIWKDRPEFHSDEVAGFEYWCNTMKAKSKQSLPWHIAKDEEELNQNNKLVTPVMGAVFYGFKHDNTFDGGLLQLVDADIYDDPLQFESVRKHEVVEIKPNFNRMIIFNATKWHKVTNVRPVAGNIAGARYAFAVNANRQKPKRLSSGKQKSKW